MMLWVLVVVRLWGNLAGSTDVDQVYATREACHADKRYWELNSPEKRVYAECRAVYIDQGVLDLMVKR